MSSGPRGLPYLECPLATIGRRSSRRLRRPFVRVQSRWRQPDGRSTPGPSRPSESLQPVSRTRPRIPPPRDARVQLFPRRPFRGPPLGYQRSARQDRVRESSALLPLQWVCRNESRAALIRIDEPNAANLRRRTRRTAYAAVNQVLDPKRCPLLGACLKGCGVLKQRRSENRGLIPPETRTQEELSLAAPCRVIDGKKVARDLRVGDDRIVDIGKSHVWRAMTVARST